MEAQHTTLESKPEDFDDFEDYEIGLRTASGSPFSFVIDTEERANWLLRKLGNIHAERERVKANFATLILDLDAKEQRLKDRFEADLQQFARKQLEGQKGKTLKLLQGSVSFRTVPASLKIADKEAAIVYLKRNCQASINDFVEIIETEKLKTEQYAQYAKDYLHNVGEILPGVEVVPERESFSVKF